MLGDARLDVIGPGDEGDRRRPQVPGIAGRRVVEAEAGVAGLELAGVLEEDDDLARGVGVGGHAVPGLRGQVGSVLGHGGVHPLGQHAVGALHRRNAVEARLQGIGLLGAPAALGPQLGGTLLHRHALGGTEAVRLGLGRVGGHELLPSTLRSSHSAGPPSPSEVDARQKAATMSLSPSAWEPH